MRLTAAANTFCCHGFLESDCSLKEFFITHNVCNWLIQWTHYDEQFTPDLILLWLSCQSSYFMASLFRNPGEFTCLLLQVYMHTLYFLKVVVVFKNEWWLRSGRKLVLADCDGSVRQVVIYCVRAVRSQSQVLALLLAVKMPADQPPCIKEEGNY